MTLREAMEKLILYIFKKFYVDNKIPPTIFLFDEDFDNMRHYSLSSILSNEEDLKTEEIAACFKKFVDEEEPWVYVVARGGQVEIERDVDGEKVKAVIQAAILIGSKKSGENLHLFYKYMPVAGTKHVALAQPMEIELKSKNLLSDLYNAETLPVTMKKLPQGRNPDLN